MGIDKNPFILVHSGGLNFEFFFNHGAGSLEELTKILSFWCILVHKMGGFDKKLGATYN